MTQRFSTRAMLFTAPGLTAIVLAGAVSAQTVKVPIQPAPAAPAAAPAPAPGALIRGSSRALPASRPAAARKAAVKSQAAKAQPAVAGRNLEAAADSPQFGEVSTGASSEPMASYIIKKGDTLWGLADKYFVRLPTYEEVRVRNGVKFERRMSVGLELLIPIRLLKTAPVDAQLGAFKGDVTISGTPGPLAAGAAVHQGAVIATGANAFARIDLPDGSRVSVPSQSRMRLQIMHRVLLTGAVERTFMVEAGRSESSVAPIKGPQDNYFVRTPVSVSAVRGTDFRVGYEQGDKAATTGVVEGSVAVDAPSGSVMVPEKFGVGVKPGASLAVVPLLPAPGVIDAARLQDRHLVVFDVDGVEGAKAYRMQLAADEGMLEIFAEQTHPDPHFEFEGLANGTYFQRVTALDKSDIEGLPRVYAFERDLNSLTPTGFGMQREGADRRFLFKWIAEGEGQRTYRFQVSRQPSAEAPLIDEGGLKDPQITVTNLPPGEYHWRVMSTTSNKGRIVELWSPPQTFTVPGN